MTDEESNRIDSHNRQVLALLDMVKDGFLRFIYSVTWTLWVVFGILLYIVCDFFSLRWNWYSVLPWFFLGCLLLAVPLWFAVHWRLRVLDQKAKAWNTGEKPKDEAPVKTDQPPAPEPEVNWSFVEQTRPNLPAPSAPSAAALWKTLRVFISSTFKDMHAERDHLVRFVFPKLREELMKRHIHLIDVDLRWGVTSDMDAMTVCREVIDECHPRFIGLLGGRYGWVPAGREVSITADEIHYGVLGRELAQRGNAYFYFRDEVATAAMVESLPGDFREPENSESARKLADLKQSISRLGLPVFYYPAGWNDTEQRLVGLEVFGERVQADLLANIRNDPELAGRFAGVDAAPSDEFAEARAAVEDFIDERADQYVIGTRESILETMAAFAAAREGRVFALEGEPGSGKSSLLGVLCRKLADDPSTFVLPHFFGVGLNSTDLRHTLRRLCQEIRSEFSSTFERHAAARLAQLARECEEEVKERPWRKESLLKEAEDQSRKIAQEYALPDEPAALVSAFERFLKWTDPGRPVIIILDAVNQLEETDDAHGMAWLPKDLPPHVRFIVSTLPHQVLEALRQRDDTRIEKLAALTPGDASEIIAIFLQRYSKRLSEEQLHSLLSKEESYLPLYLRVALEELRTLGTYGEITARIVELPGETQALFGWILGTRLPADPGFVGADGQPCGAALVEKLCSCLGASRHGLSQGELVGLLDPGDPRGNVAALLRLLRPYLMRRGELLDAFHSQLRKAMTENYLKDNASHLAAHRALAHHFHQQVDPAGDRRWHNAPVHALSELPFHLARADSHDLLVRVLEDLFFLEAKVSCGMAYDLASDFFDAVAHLRDDNLFRPRLKLLGEALWRNLGFIARHATSYPQALFQCLWNSCWWYDSPSAAAHYQVPDEGWTSPPPWIAPDSAIKLCVLLEGWRTQREAAHPEDVWVRVLRPPAIPLVGSQLAVWRGGKGPVFSSAFSPDGRFIFGGSGKGGVQMWDTDRGTLVKMLGQPETAIRHIALSPDGRFILATGMAPDEKSPGPMSLCDFAVGDEMVAFNGLSPAITAVFSPDGRFILAGGADRAARLWDAANISVTINLV
jgi:hypothetical protein